MNRSQAPRRDERAEARNVRERFLTAITERVPPHRIAELHLFPPMRQGGLETGIAVIAAYPEAAEVAAEAAPEVDEAAAGGAASQGGEGGGAPPRHHDAAAPAEAPHPICADAIARPRAGERGGVADRLTVYRATYRWVRKGPDRGRWEVDVRAEADAPLETVEDIVRGVHRRAGGEAEPERLSADAVRAALAERPWTSPT